MSFGSWFWETKFDIVSIYLWWFMYENESKTCFESSLCYVREVINLKLLRRAPLFIERVAFGCQVGVSLELSKAWIFGIVSQKNCKYELKIEKVGKHLKIRRFGVESAESTLGPKVQNCAFFNYYSCCCCSYFGDFGVFFSNFYFLEFHITLDLFFSLCLSQEY